eukprot:757827-Pleurochrysis_carterae.AAC.2
MDGFSDPNNPDRVSFPCCTSLPMRIARRVRIPSSSLTLDLARIRTMQTRLISLQPTSLLPGWIVCFLGSRATLTLAAAAVVRTSIRTPLIPSFQLSSPARCHARRQIAACD